MSKLRVKTSIILCFTTLAFMHNSLAADTPQDDAKKSESSEPPSKSEGYLKEIRDILLANVNKLPVYLNQLTKMALSWLAPDNSESTAIQQKNFSTLANVKFENTKMQLDDQNKLLTDFLNPLSKTDTIPGPVTNVISYQTLLNQPPFKSPTSQPPALTHNPEAAYIYIQNAAALNIHHKKPPFAISNNDKDVTAANQYNNYFMTTSAVQTYNGYILSELYDDFKNNNKAKKTQDELIKNASQPNWFQQIASENLGVVLRQILMYNSQTYVVLAELLETQKKLLAAEAMNNALLITVSQETEKRLYQRANGEPPTP